jgi:hypothetical protein
MYKLSEDENPQIMIREFLTIKFSYFKLETCFTAKNKESNSISSVDEVVNRFNKLSFISSDSELVMIPLHYEQKCYNLRNNNVFTQKCQLFA